MGAVRWRIRTTVLVVVLGLGAALLPIDLAAADARRGGVIDLDDVFDPTDPPTAETIRIAGRSERSASVDDRDVFDEAFEEFAEDAARRPIDAAEPASREAPPLAQLPLDVAPSAAEGAISDRAVVQRTGDNRYVLEVMDEPTFRPNAEGEVVELDETVLPSARADVAATVPRAAVPVEFGTRPDRLIRLGSGPDALELSSAGLSVRRPELRDGVVRYRDVASSVDLEYEVLPDGLKETFVLRSPRSPSRFTMLLEDPEHKLGVPSEDEAGWWVFSGELADGHKLTIPKAIALDADDLESGYPPDPESAGLRIRTVDGGYEIEVWAEPTWLKQATFPVSLDPTMKFYTGGSGGPPALEGYSWQGYGDVFRTSGSGGWPYLYAGSVGQYSKLRSYLWYPMWHLIRRGSVVNTSTSAGQGTRYEPLVNTCLGSGFHGPCQGGGAIWLAEMTGGWGYSTSYSTLLSKTGGLIDWELSESPTNPYGQQRFNVGNLVQKWVNDPYSNFGFTLLASAEATKPSGLAWDANADANLATHGRWPVLYVQYTVTRPAAPVSVAASTAAHAVNVSWNEGPVTGGTIADNYYVELIDRVTDTVTAQKTVAGEALAPAAPQTEHDHAPGWLDDDQRNLGL